MKELTSFSRAEVAEAEKKTAFSRAHKLTTFSRSVRLVHLPRRLEKGAK